MRRRFLALGAVLVGLTAGCSTGTHRSAAPPTTATTSAAVNPDVVPAVITPAYVDAVFAVLEHIDGNASRALIAANAVTPEVLADIRAIYNDPLYAQEVKIAQQSIQGNLSNIRRPPGDVRIRVKRLIFASSQCVFVEADSDYGAVVYAPPNKPASEYWELRPKQSGADPARINATPWALAFNRTFETPTSIPNQCVS